MNEYVVLISDNPEHRKSLHRHIVESETIEDAALIATEICSHGQNLDSVIEVFEESGDFFSFDLQPFTPPDTR